MPPCRHEPAGRFGPQTQPHSCAGRDDCPMNGSLMTLTRPHQLVSCGRLGPADGARSTIAYSRPMTQPHRPVGPGDHVFLVDGSSFVFRAYYQSIRQDQKYNYRSDRLPIGAVRLFATKMLQFVRDGAAGIKPTHLAIIFDKSENSFRREIYPAYKSHRPDPPADLVPQFPLMRATVRAFGMIPVEQDRYEADDLIATYARQARERGADVLIVSADKDLMQLIEPGVAMYDPASGDREERRIGVGGSRRLFRRRARQGRRRPGARRRFDRQRARRARHRRQDRRPAHRRIRRPRDAARPRRRDQAAQAPRGADRAGERRAHPHLEEARDAGARRRRRDAARRPRGPEARRQGARRLPEGDGAHHDHPPRRRDLRRSTSPRSSPTRASSARPAGRAATARRRSRRRRRRRPRRPRLRGRRRRAGRRDPADLARARAGEAKAPIDRAAYRTVRTARPASRLGRRAHDAGIVAFDARDLLARPAPGRSRRRVARGRPGRGLLHPDRPSHRRRRSLRRRRLGARTRSRRRTRSRC